MHKWIDAGLFQTAYTRLFRLYRRRSRPRSSCVDTTVVKNVCGVDCVGVTRPTEVAWPPSFPLQSDDKGVPYSLLCTPASQSDMRLLQPTYAAGIVPASAGTPLYAGKGYDSATNRHICAAYATATVSSADGHPIDIVKIVYVRDR